MLRLTDIKLPLDHDEGAINAAIIEKLATTLPMMFKNKRVAGKMKAGGSPMRIMSRDEVKAMWAKREETLKELLADL